MGGKDAVMGRWGPTLRAQGLQGYMVPAPPACSLEAQGAQGPREGVGGAEGWGRRVGCVQATRCVVRKVQVGLRCEVEAVDAILPQRQGVRSWNLRGERVHIYHCPPTTPCPATRYCAHMEATILVTSR